MAYDGSADAVAATNADNTAGRDFVGTSKRSTAFRTIHHLDACVVRLSTILSPGNC